MKPTRPLVLLFVTLATATTAFFIAGFLVGRGFSIPASPSNLVVTVAAIATVLLALAVPIWRYRAALKDHSGKRPKRVDPFYAVRVLLLAKASSMGGSLFLGWHLGVISFQMATPVVAFSPLLQNLLGAFSSLVLIIAALVTEQICRLPKDSSSEPDEAVGV